MFRLACDVGGTFTDVVARDDAGGTVFTKVATTPANPVEGVLNGIDRLARQIGMEPAELLAQTSELVHGTTTATNVLAQGRLARVGLLTTQGFADVLELRDGTRADRYQLRVPFPPPLIPRHLRLEVRERMNFDGSVLVALDEAGTRDAIDRLLGADVESVLVGLLHAHRNPAHELRIAQLLREAGWSGPVVLSHRVLAQEGEYLRFSTAAIEAGVAPSLQGYLENLREEIERKAGRQLPIQVMQSSGGLLPITATTGRAARFVNSGPAGGAIAAAGISNSLGKDVVAFDIGGTTTDISIIRDGKPTERLLTRNDAYLIGLPTIDINVLSLGGGSIASVGSDGVLQLGPQSAGAVPGPAAYGRGGQRATLTDAAVVLGLLPQDAKDGLPLSRELANGAVSRDVAVPLGLSVENAAEAIFTLASTIVAAGVRAATVGQGIDPREMVLMGFGGGGGLLLGAVAREIGTQSAVAPNAASVLSAAGFLEADLRLDTMRHFGQPLRAVPAPDFAGFARAMIRELQQMREQFAFNGEGVEFSWIAECRYSRQTGTIAVQVLADELDGWHADDIVSRFEARYMALFGHLHPGEACVIDALRLVVTQAAANRNSGSRHTTPAPPDPASAKTTSRSVYSNGGWSEWIVVSDSDIAPGTALSGPLLCHIGGGVIVVAADEDLAIDDQRTLHLSQRKPAQ